MRLFFIRHGETTGDVEDRYGGDYDDSLTEKGIAQANELAAKLKGKGIEAVYTSSLLRARETAKIIADTVGCTCFVRPELKERNQYAALSGLTKAEAMQSNPEFVEMLKDRRNTIEGAESYDDFSARIAHGFEALVELFDYSTSDTAAIVWHGGPMRVLFRDVLKWGELTELGDCSYVELEQDGDTWKLKSSSGITIAS